MDQNETQSPRMWAGMPGSAVLCYVDSPWAYFTTRPLEKQWGDDWNDAPYEHNAGTPYTPSKSFGTVRRNMNGRRIVRVTKPGATPDEDWVEGSEYDEDGKPEWEIFRIAYDGDLETPREGQRNSPWSVEQINAGAVAWLRTSRWFDGKPVVIPAGTTLTQFCKLVAEAGGAAYLPNISAQRRETNL